VGEVYRARHDLARQPAEMKKKAPALGGAPDRVRPGDWLLVEWVATAKPGDPFPEPWCHAHAPLKTMIGLLVQLGVIELPPPEADVATIASEASTAARLWLEKHPQPDPAPADVPPPMKWGPGSKA